MLGTCPDDSNPASTCDIDKEGDCLKKQSVLSDGEIN